MRRTTCSLGTYQRDAAGVWRYEWGPHVPGARDLLLSAALAVRDPARAELGAPLPAVTSEELTWARELFGIDEPLAIRSEDGYRDYIVGIDAPELQASLMMTVVDIAAAAEVSKATVDSYRYRGYLPEPQMVKGRTPLWARPVIWHWLGTRPGSGWRTDVYGRRDEFEPERSLPISSVRQARERRSGNGRRTRPASSGRV